MSKKVKTRRTHVRFVTDEIGITFTHEKIVELIKETTEYKQALKELHDAGYKDSEIHRDVTAEDDDIYVYFEAKRSEKTNT